MPDDVFHQAFSERLKALSALAARDVGALEDSAKQLELLGSTYGNFSPGRDIAAFSKALNCLALQWRWLEAVRSAEPDADRFKRAAKMQADDHFKSNTRTKSEGFDELIKNVGDAKDTEHIADVEKRLASTSMPFAVSIPEGGIRLGGQKRVKKVEPPKKPEIAFVKFDINGVPAKTLGTLAPQIAHDMTLHLRVSNWPKSAERLVIEPVSIEDLDCYELPSFVIDKPANNQAVTVFERTGRLVLKLAHAIGARPFEFKYRAFFDPRSSGQVDLHGHRTLRLESLDPSGKMLTGYASIDTKLLEIRRHLKTLPGLPDSDVGAAMTLLSAIGNVAGQAVQDKLFPANMLEEPFQAKLKQLLRARPEIGSALEEHPVSGGGPADLSFEQIRLELKAEPKHSPTEHRLSKYADQTAQYAVSVSKRIGVLCVLDSRQMTEPPVPPESLFSIITKHPESGGVAIVTVIIQGGLLRPSDLSR